LSPFFFLSTRRPPTPTLFPYTTLFRSATKGFPGASVAELAKACGASKSLIYHYFPSKDDILYAVMVEHLDALTEAAETACATGRDRKSTRLNSSHSQISYAVFCLKKKK